MKQAALRCPLAGFCFCGVCFSSTGLNVSGHRAHGVLFYFPLIFHCPTPHPLATHTSHAVLTPWTIQGMTCPLPWKKAKDFIHSLKTNSQIAFLLTYLPHLPCHCPLPPCSLANDLLGSDWEALCLDNNSVLSAVTALLSPPQAAALAVRYASKKTGGSSKNLGGKSPGKRFGLKKMEGTDVLWLSFPNCTLPSALGVSLKGRKTI